MKGMADEIRNDGIMTDGEETMASLLDQSDGYGDIHRGKVVKGIIRSASDDGWLVDVGAKCEGFLPKKEWTHHVLIETAEEPSVGDTVRVQVTNYSQGEELQLSLSRWRCEFDTRWNKLEEEIEKNDIIEVKGISRVKGGLIVDCLGLQGFIPISHLAEDGRGINPGRLIDQTFAAKVIDRDRRKRRFVLSRRSILEKEQGAEREKFYETVHEGDILEGEVSSITDFGAFVRFGTIEGLVHITELAWARNPKPKEIVKIGDTVKVKVVGIDKEKNRISLSIKQTIDNPWNNVADHWAKDQVTEGVVTNITDFGVFVEIEPGVEGLIHVIDLGWRPVKNPKDIMKRGQTVKVVILDVDTERRRISLGYKQLNDPWKDVEQRYSKGQEVKVKVIRLADFGAFVELEPGVEGLIHISQISRQRVEKPGDVLSVGQETQAKILEIDMATRRIRLSIKALLPEEEHSRRSDDSERDGERRHAPERRGRREDGESRHRERAPQMPTEEMSVTIGDLLRGHEE